MRLALFHRYFAPDTPPYGATVGLTTRQRAIKRAFDLAGAALGLLTCGLAIPILALIARITCHSSGIFRQVRVGLNGQHFQILKLRTMRTSATFATTVTKAGDPRIVAFGALLRRYKLDELPQLINVLRGDMSFVGPRPDVPEFVPLQGAQARTVLSVRPGITGPATLVFRGEEELLGRQDDPEGHNMSVLVPTKARINEHYVRTWSFRKDIEYIILTIRGGVLTEAEAMA